MALGSNRLVGQGVAFDIEGGQHDRCDVGGLSSHLIFQQPDAGLDLLFRGVAYTRQVQTGGDLGVGWVGAHNAY